MEAVQEAVQQTVRGGYHRRLLKVAIKGSCYRIHILVIGGYHKRLL